MRIAVIGAGGYVGLANAVGFALLGHEVLGIEINPEKLEKLKSGEPTFYEPDALLRPIQSGLRDALSTGRLEFSRSDGDASDCDVIVVCVGTPLTIGGQLDTSSLQSLADSFFETWLENDRAVVIRSTLPLDFVRTLEARFQSGTLVVHPEFLREGRTLEDFLNPWVLLWGGPTEYLLSDLYEDLAGRVPIHVVTRLEAALAKLAWNAFSSVRIGFILGLTIFCNELGCDPTRVRNVLELLPKVFGFPRPGFPFGGPCLIKDTLELANSSTILGPVLRAALEFNRFALDAIVEQVRLAVSCNSIIGIYGVAFKKGTDDLRLSPALDLIRRLRSAGYSQFAVYDPSIGLERLSHELEANLSNLMGITIVASFEDLLKSEPAAIVLTFPPTAEDAKLIASFGGLVIDPWHDVRLWATCERYWTWGLQE